MTFAHSSEVVALLKRVAALEKENAVLQAHAVINEHRRKRTMAIESRVKDPGRNPPAFGSKLAAASQLYEVLKGFNASDRHQLVQMVNSQLTREGK